MLQFEMRAMAMTLVLACLGPVAQVQARDQASKESATRDIRSLSYTEKQQLLERIRKVLRHVLDTTDIESFSGRSAYTPLKVKFRREAHNEVLVIDLGAVNGPASSSGDSEELGFQLESAMADLLDKLGISYPDVDYEFGGGDWYYYNPEDLQYQREYERRMQLKDGQSAIPPRGAKVAICAMLLRAGAAGPAPARGDPRRVAGHHAARFGDTHMSMRARNTVSPASSATCTSNGRA